MADREASAEVRVLTPADAWRFERIAEGVFDHSVQERLVAEFLADPRHSLAVAIADGLIVGMASGVRYVHPDKPSEFWINEVGVSPDYQRRGLAKRIVVELLAEGRRQGVMRRGCSPTSTTKRPGRPTGPPAAWSAGPS